MDSNNIDEGRWQAAHEYPEKDPTTIGAPGIVSHDTSSFFQDCFLFFADESVLLHSSSKYEDYGRRRTNTRLQWFWLNVFLFLSFAIESQALIAFRPTLFRVGVNGSTHPQNLTRLFAQLIWCFLAEHACYRWLPRFPTVCSSEEEISQYGDMQGSSTPSDLATEYMVPRVVFFLVLAGDALPRPLATTFSRFRFASVFAWMVLRQYKVIWGG